MSSLITVVRVPLETGQNIGSSNPLVVSWGLLIGSVFGEIFGSKHTPHIKEMGPPYSFER